MTGNFKLANQERFLIVCFQMKSGKEKKERVLKIIFICYLAEANVL